MNRRITNDLIVRKIKGIRLSYHHQKHKEFYFITTYSINDNNLKIKNNLFILMKIINPFMTPKSS
jgi:hypothetical protein